VRNSALPIGSFSAATIGRRPRRRRLAPPLLLLLVCLTGGRVLAETNSKAPAAPRGPGLSFAIADFDGDRLPDFVSVETGRSSLAETEYNVQLRLTAVRSLRAT
jgi:hypothetical protein